MTSPDSTPADIRALAQSAKLLLRNAAPSLAGRAYEPEVLLASADRLRIEDGQCPPTLQRN